MKYGKNHICEIIDIYNYYLSSPLRVRLSSFLMDIVRWKGNFIVGIFLQFV